MYIAIRGNRVYLMESVWGVNSKGKKGSTSRVVKPLGKVSDLTANDPDAIEKLRAHYKAQRSTSVASQETLKLIGSISEPPGDKTEDEAKVKAENKTEGDITYLDWANSVAYTLKYANCAVRPLWTKTLGMKACLESIQKSDGIDFDASEMIYEVVVDRMLYPSSDPAEYEPHIEWLGGMRNICSDVDLLRMLEFAYKHKDRILEVLEKNLKAFGLTEDADVAEHFEVFKKRLSRKPGAKRMPERTEAAALICVLAEFMIVVLTQKLKANGNEIGVRKIYEVLREGAVMVQIFPGARMRFHPLRGEADRPAIIKGRLQPIDLTAPTAMSHVVTATGLTPLVVGCTKSAVEQRLKIRFAGEDKPFAASYDFEG